jgi:hypothetical protein
VATPDYTDNDGYVDDDELFKRVLDRIDEWKTANSPSLTQVQTLFHELISAGGTPMLRDTVVAAIISAFGAELGGKAALKGTWTLIANVATKDARETGTDRECPPLTAEQKAEMRDALWPSVRELAQDPDLLNRVVREVQSRGVVNEPESIKFIYLAATSRVLDKPINPLLKGASGSGKNFTMTHTLELIGSDFVSYLTSSSALSLAYDHRPLAHTVLVVCEATQLQGNENSIFAMLLRVLLSEGCIRHQTTVEDRASPTGRRVVEIVREGPISLMITTTGELHEENDTRMLPFGISEDHDQTRAVIDSLASSAAGLADAPTHLAKWHDLQQWIALGPNDAVVPYAIQIAAKIPPSMVRFRRDFGALLSLIKTSAILHQAQRQIDAQGRVVATLADYALVYPIFSKVLAQTSGEGVTDSVRAVVDLVAKRVAPFAAKPTAGRFTRTGVNAAGPEVILSSRQIGTLTGLGKSAAYRAVLSAIERGFLANNENRPGKPYRLIVLQRINDDTSALLPHPDTLLSEGG